MFTLEGRSLLQNRGNNSPSRLRNKPQASQQSERTATNQIFASPMKLLLVCVLLVGAFVLYGPVLEEHEECDLKPVERNLEIKLPEVPVQETSPKEDLPQSSPCKEGQHYFLRIGACKDVEPLEEAEAKSLEGCSQLCRWKPQCSAFAFGEGRCQLFDEVSCESSSNGKFKFYAIIPLTCCQTPTIRCVGTALGKSHEETCGLVMLPECEGIYDLGPFRIHVLKHNMFRIYKPENRQGMFPKENFMQDPRVTFDPVDVKADKTEISTSSSRIVLDHKRLVFYHNGEKVIEEHSYGFFDKHKEKWSLRPHYGLYQKWYLDKDVGVYGGGGHQDTMVNYRHAMVDLTQSNKEVAVPFFVTSTGVGILWHQYGKVHINQCDELISKKKKAIDRMNQVVEAEYTAERTGAHDFTYIIAEFIYCCKNRFFINGEEIYHDRGSLFPEEQAFRVWMEKGKTYTIRYQGPGMLGFCITHQKEYFELRAYESDVVDYYMMFGDSVDGTIGLYRELTGPPLIFPLYVYGFWQCKERYVTQNEIVKAAERFRKDKIPADAIVQDWQYWGPDEQWGPHFNTSVFPEPKQMVDRLHELNFRLMVSIWARFGPATEFYRSMVYRKLNIPDTRWVDPSSEEGRRWYWDVCKEQLIAMGVDALWIDGTEPDELPNRGKQLAIGPGSEWLNAYSLMLLKGVWEGWRRDLPGKRMFVLTRSSFAGQQRYGNAYWSGDTWSDYTNFRRQVSHCLNYQLSGGAYWTNDIGGFFRRAKKRGQYKDVWFQEFYTRWMQFGVFLPIFRIHGEKTNTELWHWPAKTQESFRKVIKLRYKLLPYIYSLAAMVTFQHYTMNRHLIFDFPDDPNVIYIGDQFMFGPAFFIAPIINEGGNRTVYFPDTPVGWYDWFDPSVIQTQGSREIKKEIDEWPVYIRAGSIVPIGPEMQHTREKDMRHLDIRIYRGRDCDFTLYQDDGESLQYLEGDYTMVNISWEENARKILVTNVTELEWQYVFNFVVIGGGKEPAPFNVHFGGGEFCQRLNKKTEWKNC